MKALKQVIYKELLKKEELFAGGKNVRFPQGHFNEIHVLSTTLMNLQKIKPEVIDEPSDES